MVKEKTIITGIIPRECKLKELIGKKIKYGSYEVGEIKTARVYKRDTNYIEYTAEINEITANMVLNNKLKSISIEETGFQLK